MTTIARGRHRKLRRNILHTVIATALLAGTFTVVDQVSNAPSASAATAGGNDTAFNTSLAGSAPNATVTDVARDSSGNIYVAYGTIIKKYDSSGSIVWTSPAGPRDIDNIAVDSSGNVVVGTAIGLYRVLAAGTWDSTFAANTGANPTVANGGPANTTVYAVAIQNTSPQKIIVASTTTNGAKRLARLSIAGVYEADLSAISGATINGNVRDIAIDSSNNIFVAGDFTGKVKRFNANYTTTGDAATFNTNSSSIFTADATNIAVSSGGLVAVGGPNSGVGRVRVLSSAGNQDTSFGSSLSTPVGADLAYNSSDLVFDSSGRLLVGGSFGLKRIKTDGTLDANFTTDITSTTVHSIVVQPTDQNILVGLSKSPWVKRLTPEFDVPGAPLTPTAVAGDRVATITVAAGAGSAPTGYTVTANPDGATCTVTGASGSCNITGLTNGTAYTFTAVALNGDKSSTASAASDPVTPTRVPPTFVSAANTTTGTTVILTYSETLLASPLPTASMFTVLENGVSKTISGVSIATDKVTLTLSSPIQKNSVVSVAYTAPDPVNDSTSVAAIQDSIGNDAESLTTTTFTNSSNTDTVAPQYVSGVVTESGTSLVLTYDEDLLSNAYWGNYDIWVNNVKLSGSIQYSSPTVSGRTLTITLNGVIVESTSTVKITYDGNNSYKVNDAAGNAVADFSNVILTNSSTADIVAPVFNSASTNVSGTKIILTYSEPLNATTAVPGRFTVMSAGSANPVTSVVVSGSTVELTLTNPVESDRAVSVAYSAITSSTANSNAAIQDTYGNDAASLGTTTVTNVSTLDITAPTFSSVATNAAGTKVILTYNDALNATTADPSNFTVLAGGVANTVTSAVVVGSTIELTLSTVIQDKATVTVSYSAPSSDNGPSNAAIQDAVGNDSVSLATTNVTNNSTVDTIGPSLVSSRLDGTGTILTLTYDELILNSAGATPGVGDYVVKADGQTISVTNIAIDGLKVTLTLSPRVYPDQIKTVEYIAPTVDSGTGNAALQDSAGNDSLVMSATQVTAMNSPMKYCTTGAAPTQLVDGVYAMTGVGYIDPTLPNLVQNGRFNQGLESKSFGYFGEFMTNPLGGGFSSRHTIPGWTATGGGTWTYGSHNRVSTGNFQTDPVDTGSPARVYFGNATSNNITWDGTWTHPALGWSNATINMGIHNLPQYTNSTSPGPVAIAQDIATEEGKVYRLQFWAGREFGGYSRDGIAGLQIEGYQQLYFRVLVSGDGARYTVDFVAKDSTTNIKFQNWGHAPGATELTIDTITMSDCNAPMAQADVTSGPLGQVQTTNLLSNRDGYDAPSDDESLVPSSVKLCAANEVAPSCSLTSITVNGVGSYSVDALGVMTFTPLPDYVGTPPPITYTIEDTSGAKGVTTYTPTVTPPPMFARADTTSGFLGATQTIDLTTNDIASDGATITKSSIKLCNVSAFPAEVSPNCNVPVGTPVVVAGVGSYVVNANGVMTFTPEANYVGTPPALPYIIQDSLGSQGASTYTPTVVGPPTATANTTSGPLNVAQSVNVLTNDTPGGSNGTFVTSSLALSCPTTPTTPTCTASGGSVTIAGQGTYTKASDGTVTFTPVTNYSGTPTPVRYTVTDSTGQTVSSTYTPTIIPPPTVRADTTTAGWDVTQTMNVVTSTSGANTTNTKTDSQDTAATGTTLKANSLTIDCASAANCTETVVNGVVTEVIMAGQGTYTVDPATNVITFNPVSTFIGTARPVTYSISDELNQVSTTTYTPTVNPPAPPTADPETTSGVKGAAQTTDLLVGDATSAAGITLDPTSVRLCPAETTTPQTTTACNLTTLVVSGVGTYVVVDGVMTFTPEPNFVGTPPAVVYQVTDSVGGKASSTYTPTVIPPPIVIADTTSAGWDVTQTMNVVTNAAEPGTFNASLNTGDTSAAQTTLKANSLTIDCASALDCTETVVNGVVTEVIMAGQGTYTVNPATNTITFNPVDTFVGTARPVTYSISDELNQVSSTTYTPTVTAPPAPTASPDAISLIAGSSLPFSSIFDGTTGDSDPALATKGTGGPDLTNSTVCLIDPATSVCDTDGIVEIAGEGTYTLDPVTGIVTYAADANATEGPKTAVTYQITDGLNRSVTNTLTPTIYPKPTADDDTSSGAYDTDQIITPFSNDDNVPGQQLGNLLLCGNNPVQTPNNCDKTSVTTADGVYTVVGNTVVFNPDPDFVGVATEPVRYQAKDGMNQFVNALITPTVLPPAPPTADPETTTGRQGATQSTDLLVGDATSDPDITLMPSSVRLCPETTTTPQTTTACTLTTLTVTGVGTYTVVDGVMTFVPEANYVGTPPAVVYQVTDSLGGKASSTYTPTVVGVPTASPNTTTGGKGLPQEVSLIGNDSAATGATLDPTSVKLCDPTTTPAEVAPDCTKTTVTVAGVGTYSVDSTGKMTFTPEANYVGTPTPLSYTVTDSLGSKASSTYTPTVIGTPTATADTSSGPQGVAQSINVVTNTSGTSDSAASGTTLVSSTVTLSCASAPNCTRNINGTVTIDGQGTYSASAADGTVVFTPLPTFTGTATPVTYTVSDALGQSATTTYTPTVIPAPVAVNDTSTNGQDKNQLIDVLNNDTVPTNPAGDPLNPASVKLCDPTTNPAQVAPNCTLTELTTPDGTYSVNPTTGVVTFDPIPSFTGTVSVPVRYQVSDTGTTPQTTSALITPTVIPGPTALNDTSSGPMNTAQTKTLVTNDSAATGATLNVASVKLCDPNPTAEVAPNCTKTSVTVSGVGTYAVDSSGVMTFTPVTGYSGTPAPLSYTVADNFGVKATATYTPTVIPPPTLVPDTSTGPWDTNQTRSVVTNNVNTSDSAAAGTTLADGSVRLCAPTDTAPNCTVTSGGSVVIANQGTYTIDPTTGIVTFDPLPTFTGTATPVTYSVTDALGQKSSTTYTPTVTAPAPPTADPETTSGPKGAAQTIDLLPGDATSAGGITLDPASVRLCPAATTTPQTTTPCNLTTLSVPGVGTYSVSNGVMTFTPEPNYVGTPPPVVYQVTDSVGGKASSTYTPTVIPPPTLVPDTSTGPWDTNQTRNVVTNNVNTSDSAAAGTTLAAGSVRLCAPSDTAPNCTIDGSGSVVIANQGTYTLDPATGIVTFDPLPTFVGTATPVTYSVTDALGQKSSTTYTPTVTVPPAPTATPDTVELIPGQSKVFSSIFDGTTGDAEPALATKGTGAPDLTNSTVCIIDPATSVCDTDGIVTIPGEGTYTLNPTTGIVTYAALSSATPGAKTPVTYQISDGLGRSVTSTLTPTITPPPVANPDFSTGVQGAIQTLSPVGNDRPGGGASTELFPDTRVQIPSGVFLCAANQPPPDCAASTVTVTDPATNTVLGVLTVAASGLVTFTPEPNFVGTTPPIGYQIPDNLGQKAYSTITITVVPPPAPSATIDTGSAQYNQPVTLRPWINDSAGSVPAGSSAPAPNLVATSIKLCDDNSTFVAFSGAPADCTATKVRTVEGTYEVNAATGEVVFTPVDGFTGTVKYPPTYQIWNNWTGLGGVKSATALLVPTIAPPGAPAATVDITKTKPGTSVVLNPVSNDKPGTAALDPTTIRLCGTGEISPDCTQMSVTTLDGLYVVDPTTGQVTFTPREGFTGQATIPYIIKDGLGMMALSSLIITVEDTAVVPVVKKTKVGLAKTGGTRPDLLLLLGLVAIAAAGGLRVLGRKK